jgi:hypothetical protein
MQPRRFKFFISVVFVLFAASSFGQKSEKQIGLGTGWYSHRFKDASISATSQAGASMSLLLFYRANGLKNRHHVQSVYAAPSLQSSYLLAREQTGYLQYAYHRKITEIKNVSLFGGTVIDFGGSNRNYSEAQNSYTYSKPFYDGETLATLSPSILAEMSVKDGKLTLQSWIALMGFTAHNQGRFSDGLFTGLNNLTKVDTRLSYTKSFSKRWEGRLDYQFQIMHLSYQFPHYAFTRIYSQTHLLNISLVYKFHGI